MMNPFKPAGASSAASARLRRALVTANAAEVRRALDQLKTSPDEGVAALPVLQQLVSAGDARCVDVLKDLAADKANAGAMIETRGLVQGLLVLAQTAPEAVDVLQNLAQSAISTGVSFAALNPWFTTSILSLAQPALPTSAGALKVLVILASSPRSTLAGDPWFLPQIVPCIQPPNAHLALQVLAQLCQFGRKRETLRKVFNAPDLMPRLVAVVQGTETEASDLCFDLLSHLSGDEANALAMGSNDVLLAVCVHELVTRSNSPAIAFFQDLSNYTELHPKFEALELVQTMDALVVPGDAMALRRLMFLCNVVGDRKAQWAQLESVRADREAWRGVVRILERVLGGPSFWRLSEPLMSLSCLTLVDETRRGSKDLPRLLLRALLKAEKDDDARAASLAVTCLSNYSYSAVDRDVVLALADLVPALTRLRDAKATAEWAKVANDCAGLLFQLLDKDKVVQEAQAAAADGKPAAAAADHVGGATKPGARPRAMISYNWKHQALAMSLASELATHGVDAWIDVDGMKDDVMASMAKAVLECDCVFILLSPGYVDSSNCRREATFAAERRRKIIPVVVDDAVDLDSWLGILVSGLLRYALAGATLQRDVARIVKGELAQGVAPAERPSADKPTGHAALVLPDNLALWLEDKGCGDFAAGMVRRQVDFEVLRRMHERKATLTDLALLFDVTSMRQVLALQDAMDALFRG